MLARQLLAPFRAHARSLALAGVLACGDALLTLALPWLAGVAAGRLLQGQAADRAVLAILVLLAAQAFLRGASQALASRVGGRIAAALRTGVHDHIQALPLPVVQARGSAHLLTAVTQETLQLAGFGVALAVSVVPSALAGGGALILIWRIDAWVALAIASLVPVAFVLIRLASRPLHALGAQLQDAEARVSECASENIALLALIKAFTREPLESARFAQRADLSARLVSREGLGYAVVEPVAQMVAAAFATLLLWFGTVRLATPSTDAGQLVALVLYAVALARPLSRFAASFAHAQVARGALRRLHAVLQEAVERAPENLPPGPRLHGNIAFEGVRFAHPGAQDLYISLSFEVRAREFCAIVGPNGSGKSTVAALLLRFLQPQEGRIAVDGHDIAALPLPRLRRQIGWVPQRPLFLNGTVAQNIAYGCPGATREAVVAAAQRAGAHPFIAALPQGYDTPMGENGIRFSGGQSQRIALARALMNDPPMLVLDEPTANLDAQGDAEFERSLHALRGRTTVLLITHRPEVMAGADQVIRLPR